MWLSAAPPSTPPLVSQPLLVPGDLTDEETVKKTVEQTLAHYDRLDVLVNSAGILAMGSIETSDLAQYDKVMNINVRYDLARPRKHRCRIEVKTTHRDEQANSHPAFCTLTGKTPLPPKRQLVVMRLFFIATNYRHCGLKVIVASDTEWLQKQPVYKQIHFSPFSSRLRRSVSLEDVLQKHNSSIRTGANGKTARNNNPSSKQKLVNSLIF